MLKAPKQFPLALSLTSTSGTYNFFFTNTLIGQCHHPLHTQAPPPPPHTPHNNSPGHFLVNRQKTISPFIGPISVLQILAHSCWGLNGHFLSFEVGQNEQVQFKFYFLHPQSKQSIHILILGLELRLRKLVPNQTWASVRVSTQC